MTRDIWHVTHGGGWTFSQSFSSLTLTVWDLWYLEDWEEKDRWRSDLINYEAVCRTAPATQGLLITLGTCNLPHLVSDYQHLPDHPTPHSCVLWNSLARECNTTNTPSAPSRTHWSKNGNDQSISHAKKPLNRTKVTGTSLKEGFFWQFRFSQVHLWKAHPLI